ncbi:hypothetical protein ACYTKI_005124, partial [Escherichia albertii]
SDIWDASWVNEKLTTGLSSFCHTTRQQTTFTSSRHEAESLKRRAHHSPYICTLTTLTFPENNQVVQPVSVAGNNASSYCHPVSQ